MNMSWSEENDFFFYRRERTAAVCYARYSSARVAVGLNSGHSTTLSEPTKFDPIAPQTLQRAHNLARRCFGHGTVAHSPVGTNTHQHPLCIVILA